MDAAAELSPRTVGYRSVETPTADPFTFAPGARRFEVPDPEATVERLAAEGIVVRALPSPDAVRASLHAVNTAEGVDRLVDALGEEW